VEIPNPNTTNTTKEIPNANTTKQIPMLNHPTKLKPKLGFGIWDFLGIWSLGFGI
jgi:hypothetical protein